MIESLTEEFFNVHFIDTAIVYGITVMVILIAVVLYEVLKHAKND